VIRDRDRLMLRSDSEDLLSALLNVTNRVARSLVPLLPDALSYVATSLCTMCSSFDGVVRLCAPPCINDQYSGSPIASMYSHDPTRFPVL
jgi:hypothetical protein